MSEYIQILAVLISIFVGVYIFVNRRRKKKNQKILIFLINLFFGFFLALFSFILLYFILLIIFVPDSNLENLIDLNNNCHISLISTGDYEERIYLRDGTIFAFRNNPEKEYNIVWHAVHYNFEQLTKIICFDTIEDAEEAGYMESESSRNNRENPRYLEN